MRLLLAVLLTATFALADDWTGKSIKPKEAVKLGRKVGNGIARDGAEVDTKKSYVVKSDDGTLLELADGYIFKFEAELGKEPDLPKAKAKDTDAAKDKGEWFGKKVLPKRSESTIQIGDYEDDKPVYWTPHNLMNCTVREDKGGFLRLYDDRREGWVKKEDMVTAEDAPAWWDQEVKKNPNSYYGWHMRGVSWKDKKEYDNAIKDLTEAIRLKPDSSESYNSRGNAWVCKQEHDKAVADYTEAIRLDPKNATAYICRGMALADKKEYDKAIADYTEAIRLDSKYAGSFNNLAWLHATCPDAKFRDGKKAVEYGKKAIDLSPSWSKYDTLAAAYAEAGDFDMAVKEQTKAIELLKAEKEFDKDELKKSEARLQLYRDKKPYREE